jgi:predicted deacylase
VLTDEILRRADALLNFHTGPWGSTMTCVDYLPDPGDQTLADKIGGMVVAFGFPSIRAMPAVHGLPGPRSIAGYAVQVLGVPSISPIVGGAGFDAAMEDGWLQANAAGIRNVMVHLGMIDGAIALPERFFVCRTRGHRVVPRRGGLLAPMLGPEALLTDVAKGVLLGRVVSPYTFETIEELRAPVDGVLFGAARAYPVRPGDWAYFMADAVGRGSRWVDSADTVAATAERLRSG